MRTDSLIKLQDLLAQVTAAMRPGEGEKIADPAQVGAAQKLGCEVATGATFTKLIAAIEAEIAMLHNRI